MNLINFDPHRHSNNRQYGFLATRPNLCALSWSRQCVSMELGMFLLSARTAELEVRRDDDKWSHLPLTRSHWGLQRHLLFLLSVETSPSFHEVLLWDLHFFTGWSSLRMDSRTPKSRPDNIIVPSAVHTFSVLLLPLLWVFEHEFLTRPKFPPQCLQRKYLLSKFLPRTIR